MLLKRRAVYTHTECRDNPMPWQGLILPPAALSLRWDSHSQPCPSAVPDVTLTAVTRVPGSYGGSVRATLGSETTKAGTDTGVHGCGVAVHTAFTLCVCMYICRSPATLEDFHCSQKPLQVRFLFLTLPRRAGTPLSQKSDTRKACLILPVMVPLSLLPSFSESFLFNHLFTLPGSL